MFTISMSKLKCILYGTIPYFCVKALNPSSPKLVYYNYFRKKGYTRYPYAFAEKYQQMSIEVLWDKDKGLPYVIHRESKRLYFPKEYTPAQIMKNYKALLIEQDGEHPHHYADSLEEFRGKTLLDVGSAEGFTALDTIELTRFVYLFEYEDKWIEALQATFEPWKENVAIIKKYVGNRNDAMNVTLDEFLKERPRKDLFLKMDIEGAECEALEGCVNLFSEAENLDFAICTYHKEEDEVKIPAFLDRFHCSYSFNEGYMFVKHSFRKCLVRGSSPGHSR